MSRFFSDLTLVHRPKPEIFASSDFQLVWSTCLRSVAVARPSELRNRTGAMPNVDQVLTGGGAYQFLLELVSGLKSQVVGETEIQGQFKVFSEKWLSAEPFRAPLIQRLLADVRHLRRLYLDNLGCHSYGSWLRKACVADEVHVIGAGVLAEQIAPYLKKDLSRFVLHLRSLVPDWAKDFEVQPMIDRAFGGGALVVAAPIAANEIIRWLGDKKPQQIFDLRDVSETDPIVLGSAHVAPVITLPMVFESMQASRLAARPKVEAALREAELCTERAQEALLLRPLGWDDLCA